MNPSTNVCSCPNPPFGALRLGVSSDFPALWPPFSPQPPFARLPGPATGFFNGLHVKSKFLAVVGDLAGFTKMASHQQATAISQ